MECAATDDCFTEAFSPTLGHSIYEPLFRNWIAVQRRYATQCEFKDFAHNYSERPQVGFVAAAVWLAGGVALEEWKTQKIGGEESRTGRCDLWFSLPGKGSYHAEAKHAWLTIGHDSVLERATKMMSNAEMAAQALGRRDDTHLAILSASFLYPKESVVESQVSRQNRIHDQTMRSFDTVAKELNCPHAALFLRGERIEANDKNKIATGVALFVKQVSVAEKTTEPC